MGGFILKRLGLAVCVALAVSILAFLLLRLSGDPAVAIAGEGARQVDIDLIRQTYGFDRPLPLQYLEWLGRILMGDFGESIYFKMPAAPLIFSKLSTTLSLGLAALLLAASLLFGFHITGDLLASFVPIIPMLAGLYGFGFAFAALVMVLREANTLVDVSSFLVQTFSGANFPVNSLPSWLLPVSLALPLTYGFDAVRGILLDIPTILPLAWELVLLFVFMVLMLWLGSWTFARLERRVRQMGTLGQH